MMCKRGLKIVITLGILIIALFMTSCTHTDTAYLQRQLGLSRCTIAGKIMHEATKEH